MNGVIVVNKEKDYTSRDIVNIISKKLNIKKVGHTGTLDPLATGVLVICVGKATKLVELLTCEDKEYIAEVILGISTDTLDITGNILKEKDVIINKTSILECLNKLQGEYEQEVPIYSAVKINGKKLYEYARNNEEVKLPKRKVKIKKLELIGDIKYSDSKTIFKIKCLVSKGTYIRSLINDIATNLNTIGCMKSLIRTKQGNFKIENSYSLEDIKKDNYELLDIDNLLDNLYVVKVDNYLENKIRNGAILKNLYKDDVIVFKNLNNELLAIYQIYEKDKTKIKPWKMFI